MDIQQVGIVLHILDSVSMISWMGSVIFFLSVIRPVFNKINGEVKISIISSIFKNGLAYLRVWGLLTVGLSFAILIIPVTSISQLAVVFDPLKTILWASLILVSYFAVGEGYLFKILTRYVAISKILDEKSKSRSIAHMLVIERRVPVYMVVQLCLLVSVIVVYIYFPITYALP